MFQLFGILIATQGCLLYENNPSEVRVCGDQGVRQAGQSCVCDTECESGECFTEAVTGIPGGMCFQDCTTTASCPDGTRCKYGACRPPCNSNRQCEATQICDKLGDEEACVAHCSVDAQCQSRNCNVWTNECDAAGVSEPFGGGVSATCEVDEDCKSDFCFAGGCNVFCSVSAQTCPDGSTCLRDGGDLGSCYLPCKVDDDCRRLGWPECREMPDGQRFCWPVLD